MQNKYQHIYFLFEIFQHFATSNFLFFCYSTCLTTYTAPYKWLIFAIPYFLQHPIQHKTRFTAPKPNPCNACTAGVCDWKGVVHDHLPLSCTFLIFSFTGGKCSSFNCRHYTIFFVYRFCGSHMPQNSIIIGVRRCDANGSISCHTGANKCRFYFFSEVD